MKNKFTRTATLIALSLFTSSLIAQDDITTFLKAGIENGNAQKILQAYLNPALHGMGHGINNGWYNTAKSHKILGFDIAVTASVAQIPGSEQSFNLQNLGLSDINAVDTSDGKLPTIAGSSDAPKLQYSGAINIDGNEYNLNFEFDGIPGLGVPYIPMPMVQAGVGVFKGTNLRLRYMPKYEYEGFSVDLKGGGISHNVAEWIFEKDKRPFELSIMGGFTNLNLRYTNTTEFNTDGIRASQGSGLDLNIYGLTFQGIISKTYSFLTFYGAVGYDKYNTSLNMLGDYSITYTDIYTNQTTSVNFKDPFSFNVSGNGFRSTAGIMLDLSILHIWADITANKYLSATGGVALSFR